MITVTFNGTDMQIFRDGTDITDSISGFASFELLTALMGLDRPEITEA